jgi:type I restriction enzyme S subunit
MNTPNIRFKGFSDDWEQRKLMEIADKAVDNRGKTPPISGEGTHPLIEVACLGSGAPDYSKVTKYLDDNTFETALRDYIKEGDILFSTVGSIGLVSLMDATENAAIAQNIVSFRAKENYDSKFLYAMFSNEENQYKAQRIVMGAVQPSIKVSQLIDVEYCVTQNLEEQKKIGEYFIQLDNLITLHQRKCDDLKEVKKYMLQKMFPKKGEKVPEIRFKGFDGNWEVRKLGDVTERVQGNDGRMNLPTLTISAANGWMNQVDRFSGNIAGKEQKNYTLLHKGELSYNHGNSKLAKYGTVFLLQSYPEALVPRVYHSFKMIEGNGDFIEYYFATKILDRELAKLISSGARMDGLLNINYNEFMGINIKLPSTEEQNKIAEYLRSLDNQIILYQKKLDTLKEVKKFMLQNMFPQ